MERLQFPSWNVSYAWCVALLSTGACSVFVPGIKCTISSSIQWWAGTLTLIIITGIHVHSVCRWFHSVTIILKNNTVLHNEVCQIARVERWPCSKSMTSLVIDNAARNTMMQLSGQNWFTRSLSGGYKMTNGSRVLFKNWRRSHQRNCSLWVNESSQSMSALRMVNKFYKKQCHVGCFSSPFSSLVYFWFVICKSDPRLYYLHLLALTCPLVISPCPL